MKIDKKLLALWKKEFILLDKSSVAKELRVSRKTIANAVNGKCSQSTMDKINQYLLIRKNNLKELYR